MRRRSLILGTLGLSSSALVTTAGLAAPGACQHHSVLKEEEKEENPFPITARLAQAQDASIWALPHEGWLISTAGIQRLLQFRDGRLSTQWVRSSSDGEPWLAPTEEFALTVENTRLDGGSGWVLAGVEAGAAGPRSCELRLRLRPRGQSELGIAPIEVTVGYGAYAGVAVVAQWVAVRNLGPAPVRIHTLAPALLRVTHSPTSLWNCYAVPNRGPWAHRADFPGSASLEVVADLTKQLEAPWASLIILRDGPADAGLFLGWAWSHEYQITMVPEGRDVRVTAAHRLGSGWLLGPGETMPSMRVFLGLFHGNLEDAGRAVRRFAHLHVVPPPVLAEPPAVWNSYSSLQLDVREPALLEEAAQAAALGLNVFVVDHGWERRAGDWRPRPELFGEDGAGLRRVAERVHALGLRFGLWVDLGEAAPDAPILRQQPALAAQLRGTGKLAQGYQGAHLLCLHVAGERVAEELLRLIDTYQLDWLKFDQPQIAPCVDPRHGHGTSPETGGYANILALYRVLDHLRRERPGVVLENCYSGVGYLDYGMMARTDVGWLTDDGVTGAVSPAHLQQLYRIAAMTAPLRYLLLWAAGRPDRAPQHLAYQAAAYMTGLWGVSYRLAALTGDARALLQRLVARYKHIGPLLYEGEAVFLLPKRHAPAWYAVQYTAPDASRAFVLTLRNTAGPRGERAADDETVRLVLQLLDPAAWYAVSVEHASGEVQTLGFLSGAALMKEGIPLALPRPGVAWVSVEALEAE